MQSQIGDRAGSANSAFVGFRDWRWPRKGKYPNNELDFTANLLSPYVQHEWDRVRLEATCIKGFTHSSRLPHRIPGKSCRCGLYAYTDLTEVFDRGTNVTGAVVGWGRTMLHEIGFRSQHMQVIAFEAPGKGVRYEAISALGERWGVPVMPRSALRAYAEEFGTIPTGGNLTA